MATSAHQGLESAEGDLSAVASVLGIEVIDCGIVHPMEHDIL